MMNMYGFAKDVAGTIESRFGKEAKVQRVMKNNDVELIGIAVMNEGCNVSPNVYLNDIVERYGEDVDMIAEKVMEISEKYAIPSFDADIITNFDNAKENIFCVVINAETNAERLENMPHKIVLDLAFVYKIKVNINVNEDGLTSSPVTNQLMEKWGIDVDTLHEIALENTMKTFPYFYEDMESMLREMMGIGADEMLPDMGGAPLMNVLSNKGKINGATVVFYQGVLKKISKGNNLIIIPSSIHECIVLDYEKNKNNLEMIMDLIREVNETQVAPEEVLSDHFYIYSASTNELCYLEESVTL